MRSNKPNNWDQVVNELHQRRIVQENPSSIPGWNNSWLDFSYLLAELRITRAPFPYNTKNMHSNLFISIRDSSKRDCVLYQKDGAPTSKII